MRSVSPSIGSTAISPAATEREAAELYETFAQVTNVRKIEQMHSGVFSQTAYGDEAGRRLRKLEEIYRRGNAILYKLPEEEREAFFFSCS